LDDSSPGSSNSSYVSMQLWINICHDKYMDKLKRDRRELNYKQKY
jgi:hypothetical protein